MSALVSVSNLTLTVGAGGREIVSGVSFEVAPGELVGIGQAGGGISRGIACDMPGCFDGFAQCLRGEIGCRRRTAPITGKHGHVQRPVTRLLDGFNVFISHRNRQAAAFRNFGSGIRSPQGLGVFEGVVDQFAETFLVFRYG